MPSGSVVVVIARRAERSLATLSDEADDLLDDRVIGFTASVIHEATWSRDPVCYLEDLFVDQSARGKGIGRALIQDLIDLGREHGWSRIYWHTRADNLAARRLYDKFVPADDFVRYRLFLN
jgi:GNAT superfamily N-acetyltransferase